MLWIAFRAVVEITLTGYIIPTVTTEGGSGGCFNVVRTARWVEVTAC